MQRIHPTSRPITLPDKASSPCPPRGRVELKIARSLGMDDDARSALAALLGLAKSAKIAVAGRFMPDAGVSACLSAAGITEHVEEADFFRFARVVIPYTGIASRQRRPWEEAGHRIEDLTSPRVRRAQIALGLLRMEGAQTLVIGRHEDAESQALAGAGMGTKIIEDTTDTARLVFSCAFGVICQTNLSPRRVAWLVQQLRHRYHDARVTFSDTGSPAMVAREEALERQLADCDQVVIVGDAGESSCEALAETAMRRGKPAVIVSRPEELDWLMPAPRKIAFTAGAFATDEAVRAVAVALARK
jgi:4-hydroxy-3-methylbut-2-enyl diphosphate reductase IspH